MSVLRLERKRLTAQEGEKCKKLRSKSGKMQVRCAEALASVWMLNQERLGRVLISNDFQLYFLELPSPPRRVCKFGGDL